MAKQAYEEMFLRQIEAAHREGLCPSLPVRELRFCPERRWRADFAFVEEKVLVEVQGGIWTGGRHGRGAGIENDYEKWANAACLGWTVVPVSTSQVKRGQALEWVLRILSRRP